jgi:hypothetical protein
VSEVVDDGRNGILVREEKAEVFSSAIKYIAGADKKERDRLKKEAYRTAESFSIDRSVSAALRIYSSVISKKAAFRESAYADWQRILPKIKAEWQLVKNMAKAAKSAINENAER